MQSYFINAYSGSMTGIWGVGHGVDTCNGLHVFEDFFLVTSPRVVTDLNRYIKSWRRGSNFMLYRLTELHVHDAANIGSNSYYFLT